MSGEDWSLVGYLTEKNLLTLKKIFWWLAVADLHRVSTAVVTPFCGDLALSDLSFLGRDSLSTFRAEMLVECRSIEEIGRFIDARDSLPSALRGFLMPYSREKYLAKEARLFLTVDGRGGFALIRDELASLFSLPGARYGDMLVRSAVDEGACKLSCFDSSGKLVSLYARHGFQEKVRSCWNDALAPREWDYTAWGRPDYVEMSR